MAVTAKLDAALKELQERETQMLEESQAGATLRAEGEEIRLRMNELEGSTLPQHCRSCALSGAKPGMLCPTFISELLPRLSCP